MGNTVRREPVNFDIPASPNYKFLNITNFRGLDVSSNPFELATNTASDCLNVYVDETNTLTTRPRLCKKEFKNANGDFIVPLGGTCIGVYNLHNGYLLHHIIDDKPIMRLFVDGVLKDPVSGEIPSTKCNYFEHGDSIYLLTGEKYVVIKDNVLSDVVGYVPNKSITTLKGEEIEDEGLNILSDEYTTKFFWDGLSALPEKNANVSAVENTYYTQHTLASDFYVTQAYQDYTAFGKFDDDDYLYYVMFEPSKPIEYIKLDIKSTGLSYMTETKGFWSFDGTTIYRHTLTDDNKIKTKTGTLPTDFATDKITGGQSSPNGIYCMVRCRMYSSSDSFLVLISYTSTQFDYLIMNDSKPTNTSTVWRDFVVTNNFILSLATDNDVETLHVGYSDITTAPNTFKLLATTSYFDSPTIQATPDASLVMLHSRKNIHTTYPTTIITFDNLDVGTKNTTTIQLPHGDIRLSNDKIIYGGSVHTTWYFPTHKDLFKYETFSVGNHDIPKPDGVDYVDGTHKAYFFKNKYVMIYNKWQRDVHNNYYVYNNSTEPLVTYRYKLTDDELTKMSYHKTNILQSKLHKRFDNNYWLCAGNKYYRSANNDPTYFPITEHSELGDANSEITGFNVANDTTLLAYKTDRVYLIQPFTSSLDTREYAITESKNTVGNTAINAPIVTTLTEVPLQINNDGIYGLSQLQNVSAVERIADLMSEPINDRWLNEDDKVIRNAKTLNRLYWTYIILPYESVTKIYLLDNRTNSWYYWELPIKVLEAFAKDNRAEFVDTDGNIYYLTTTDIKNAGFDTQLVTEYYDDGKKLINWFWQSQILPMGTMNYAKRLVNTTFILTDTDTQDGYGLKYNFKVFRKLASSTPEKEINDELNLVRSTTKKTNISKFGFIQLKISNITEESQGTEAEKAYRNNKLRLVGLGLKYVLLEGLIR